MERQNEETIVVRIGISVYHKGYRQRTLIIKIELFLKEFLDLRILKMSIWESKKKLH